MSSTEQYPNLYDIDIKNNILILNEINLHEYDTMSNVITSINVSQMKKSTLFDMR